MINKCLFQVYLESSDSCNHLNFMLTSSHGSTWDIQITQIPCKSELVPPVGCTQYFFGDMTGVIKVRQTFLQLKLNFEVIIPFFKQTYNFDGGMHLANQRHKFCFR